jgi:hypothetical protein
MVVVGGPPPGGPGGSDRAVCRATRRVPHRSWMTPVEADFSSRQGEAPSAPRLGAGSHGGSPSRTNSWPFLRGAVHRVEICPSRGETRLAAREAGRIQACGQRPVAAMPRSRPDPARFDEAVQYELASSTSLPAMVASAHQVGGLMELLMKRTEPSQNKEFTPAGWRLLAVMASSSLSPLSPPKEQL